MVVCIAVLARECRFVRGVLPLLLFLPLALSPSVADALILRGALEARLNGEQPPSILELGAGVPVEAFAESDEDEESAADNVFGGAIMTPVPEFFDPRRRVTRFSHTVIALIAAAKGHRNDEIDTLLNLEDRYRQDLLPLAYVGAWMADRLGLDRLAEWLRRDRGMDGIPFPGGDSTAVPLPAPAALMAGALLLLGWRAGALRRFAGKGGPEGLSRSPRRGLLRLLRAAGRRAVVLSPRRAGSPQGTTPSSRAPEPATARPHRSAVP